MSKINKFAKAVQARNNLEFCESSLKLAYTFADDELKALIGTALDVIGHKRTQYNDAVDERRKDAQRVTTIFIKDVPLEVPEGYEVKRVTMTGQLRLNVYKAESGEHLAQIVTANKDGSDVGGFAIFRKAAAMPELHVTEHSALSFFFSHYLGV